MTNKQSRGYDYGVTAVEHYSSRLFNTLTSACPHLIERGLFVRCGEFLVTINNLARHAILLANVRDLDPRRLDGTDLSTEAVAGAINHAQHNPIRVSHSLTLPLILQQASVPPDHLCVPVFEELGVVAVAADFLWDGTGHFDIRLNKTTSHDFLAYAIGEQHRLITQLCPHSAYSPEAPVGMLGDVLIGYPFPLRAVTFIRPASILLHIEKSPLNHVLYAPSVFSPSHLYKTDVHPFSFPVELQNHFETMPFPLLSHPLVKVLDGFVRAR